MASMLRPLMAIFFLMSCSGLAVQVRKVQTSLDSWERVAGVPSSYSMISL